MSSPPLSLGQFVLRAFIACAIATIAVLFGYGSIQQSEVAISDGYCNVAVVPIQGSIDAFGYTDEEGGVYTLSDDIAYRIRTAQEDPNILGLLVTIDSFGGHAGPSFDMMEAFQHTSLPTVAYIREAGTSGAYLAATGADTIIASPYAEVGSIGVTYSYTENSKQNEKDGITFVQISSGEYKDLGNPNKAFTPEERAVLEKNLKGFSEQFITDVARNRNLSTTTVSELADGSAVTAKVALEQGLVDSIGGMREVKAWFAATLELEPDAIVPCI
jgi:protease IV